MEISNIPIDAIMEIELFDVVILHHGFEDYKRDYFFIIESGTKESQGRFKVWFTHCFDLQYRHKLADKKQSDLIRKSWDDNLILPSCPESQDGYWWGQGFTVSFPGFSYDPENVKAKEISAITGRQMYAVKLETEHYDIELVFHDFRYKFMDSNTSVSNQVIIPLKGL